MNPFYLLIDHVSGYIEEKGVYKYLVFDSTDKNKELLKRYNDVWNEIKNKIKEVSNSECDYEKDYMKIKFNSGDNLPLNKPLKFHLMTITIRPVFEEDGNFSSNRNVILNTAKEYYENNKEILKEQARDKYRSLSEEEKIKRENRGRIGIIICLKKRNRD